MSDRSELYPGFGCEWWLITALLLHSVYILGLVHTNNLAQQTQLPISKFLFLANYCRYEMSPGIYNMYINQKLVWPLVERKTF